MKRKRGFTLVELVVVVLILGILAAIAAPKIINNSDRATDSSVASTLAAIRDAIEMYKADNSGKLPLAAGLTSTIFHGALDSYVRGSAFPKSPVGKKDNVVTIVTSGPTANDAAGWMYHSGTGDFIINCTSAMASDASTTYDKL